MPIKKIYSCPICGAHKIKKYLNYKQMMIFLCCSCSMMFQDPDSELCSNTELINKVNWDYLRNLDPHFSLNAERLKRIKSCMAVPLHDLKILEIGVGFGTLASLILKEKANYQGLEPSEFLYSNILKKIPQLKNVVHNKFFDPRDFQEGYFDLIIIVDTLEHIPNPVDFLRQIKKNLKTGGELYCEVPNESVLKYKAWLRKKIGMYYGYPTNPDHVNLFTLKTIKRVLAESGYHIQTISQDTILGNQNRMNIVFNRKDALWLKMICLFFRCTKIDLLLQQGVMIASCTK